MKWLVLSLLLVLASSATAATTVTLGLASNFSDASTSTSNPFGNYFRDGVSMALADSEHLLKAHDLVVVTKQFDYDTSTVRAISAAQQAAASDSVAVIGYNWSSPALVAAPVHQSSGLPMISPSASADRLSRMGAFIHVACFDNSYMGTSLAKIARSRLHAKTAAIVVASDCVYCRDLANVFRRDFERRGGQIVLKIPVLGSDQSFAKVAQLIKASTPDTILVPNQELISARVISSILATGFNRPFLGGDGWGDVGEQFFKILNGQPLEGYSLSHWHPDLHDFRSRRFINGYQQRFHKVPNDTSVLAYDATRLFVQALVAAPSKDRAGIEASLSGITHFEGVTGRFLFRRNQAPEKSIVLLKSGPKRFEVIGRLDPEQERDPK